MSDDLQQQILSEYVLATGHYAWAVGELVRQLPTLKSDEYERLYSVVENARSECEQLRAELSELRH